jgi:spore germination protein GerM
MTRTRRLLLAVAAPLLAGACTVPTNDEPVELSGSIVPETTTSTSTTSPQTATRSVFVYMLEATDGGTFLRRVPRTVPADTGLQGVLSNLFTQRPREDVELERPLTSAIPESATLLSASLDPDDPTLLTVDVRGLFGPEGLQGASLRNALGQIVWTATEGEPALRVVFRQDGERRSALVDNLESTDQAVDRDDYQRQI